MSIVGIFTQVRPQIGGIYFDATLSEATELITDVTEFPIESGAVGSDHAVQRPLSITMRVGISDNPSRAARAIAGDTLGSLAGNVAGIAVGQAIQQLPASVAALAGEAHSRIGSSIVNNAASAAGSASTRSRSALDAIRRVQRANALINVVSSKQTYKNCMITNTRQETNKENEQGLELVVEMRQLIIIPVGDTGEAQLPANDDVSTQGQPLQRLGLVG